MGNTNSPLHSSVSNSDSGGGGGSNNKRVYAAIVDMSNVVTSIAAEMKSHQQTESTHYVGTASWQG